MKVSAALQFLTTVMSGSSAAGNGSDSCSEWTSLDNSSSSSVHHHRPQHQAMSTSPSANDLDLGACLDVQTLDNFTTDLYTPTTSHSTADDTWVDNVIDMTSSGEMMSSDDHGSTMSVVPNSTGFPLAGCIPVPVAAESSEGLDFEYPDTDNAVFNLNQLHALSSTVLMGATDVIHSGSHINDFGTQFGVRALSNSAVLADTTATTSTDTTTSTTTIDLSALEQFITLDSRGGSESVTEIGGSSLLGEETSIDFPSSTSNSNIPSSLWNMDLPLSSAGASSATSPWESQPASSSSLSSSAGVKESLKSRLYSRASLHSSASLDSDVTSTSFGTRSLSSPTPSMTQSGDEDDADDPVKSLEKREKNRLAAQKCRNKKREKEETLQKSINRLEQKQERLKDEVQKLRDQRESLEEIMNVHGMFCPKVRKISNS